ncbi:MAG: hypothetical protein H6667_22090 [Ardenticatenaceae bacterium]|nr:hypothetical protein [Ardenticatenaceae bacterium]
MFRLDFGRPSGKLTGREMGNSGRASFEVVAILLRHFFEHYEETIAPPTLVTGHDLMTTFAIAPGPEIGRLLRLSQLSGCR